MAMPTWISEFQAFGTVLIGFGVATVGVQQYRIAARKLKFDLYQRRYAIFDALRLFVVSVFEDSPDKFNAAAILAYEKQAEARFLLDVKACLYIDDLIKRINSFTSLDQHMRSDSFKSYQKDPVQMAQERSEGLRWIYDQYEPLVREFERFLTLDHALKVRLLMPWRRSRLTVPNVDRLRV